MRLIFFGDCMFGRKNNPFVNNPFTNVLEILRSGTHLFFNLETTISKGIRRRNKTFTYHSNGEPLLTLRKLIQQPIFVSIANNHSLDFGPESHESTKRFLKKNGFLCNSKNKVEKKNVIFLNASDHCGCEKPTLWRQHIWMIDYNDLDHVYQKIQTIRAKTKKTIVFSIHWGSNWVDGPMPQHIQEFGRGLIDAGVDIVHGHSAHHIPDKPIEKYKHGIIIYGLGDFINDYSVREEYESDKALICIITKTGKNMDYEFIPVQRRFIEGSSIPFLL